MNRSPFPRRPSHRAFLDDDVANGHEHGERAEPVPRADPLIGTSGSHTPPLDTRAEEPSGDVDETQEGT